MELTPWASSAKDDDVIIVKELSWIGGAAHPGRYVAKSDVYYNQHQEMLMGKKDFERILDHKQKKS
ncbi:unnamed protein product, partial [marine sediment metagenome]